jgi:hypothetical protein
VQDTLAAAGLVDFTWTNAGVNIPFKFIPATAIARKVTGTIRCVPLAIGGDVKKRNTSDWSPAIIGTPVLAATP